MQGVRIATEEEESEGAVHTHMFSQGDKQSHLANTAQLCDIVGSLLHVLRLTEVPPGSVRHPFPAGSKVNKRAAGI